jgi:aspartyl-tRNA synthetase
METMQRTATCGQLTARNEGQIVILNGWVHRNRDHGGVHFINLRDRYGVTQIVVDEDAPPAIKEMAESLKYEFCVAVEGIVRKRPAEMVNPKMTTGEIEIAATTITVLNRCEPLPFMIEDGEPEANENLRLEYRYLDMRNGAMRDRIILRNKVAHTARCFLQEQNFLEIETPTLIKSTPEGARDFLVPSRIHRGKFFALPQSPQLYKQILMVSGFDRYYQIARCYRDEDARGDRQLEFTQIDLEMSFAGREDVFGVIEGLMGRIFKESLGYTLPVKFQRLSYDDAMNLYGSDKPDLRFGLKFQDFAPWVEGGEFSVFKGVLAEKGTIKALVVPGGAEYCSRKKIQELEDTAKTYGAKGLAWMKVTDQGLDGGVAKFYAANAQSIMAGLKAAPGDAILLMGAEWRVACLSLGAVRNRVARENGLIKPGTFEFAWIVDFPLFEWNEEEKKWDPAHHMFSMPRAQYLDTLETDPGAVKADIYDLVLNGYEVASGSVRIHNPELQQRIFNIVGFPVESAEERFGFLLKAFRYGAPPHAGIAPGLDRLVMIMAEKDSIKEVIAFPKNSNGLSPMDDCPAAVENGQLLDLHIRTLSEEEESRSRK